jgi:tRNA pseudouridine32 synthase / 23S rRNA pseudouridine746 synthase
LIGHHLIALLCFLLSSVWQELKVVYEDEHLVVIDKPSGVLTVSGRNGANSLAQTVCAAYPDTEMAQLGPDRMVVHRLGMDSSGLIVFAKTKVAVRGMNTVFRTRNIRRRYEALVCGHVGNRKGIIDLPLMMDYEFPPYVRISTDQHQEALLDLEDEVVGKKILERPKESITRYKVIAHEELDGHPVTRLELTSISGRYHQLNCHLATIGHPIVGDKVYSIDGEAAPNGGLEMDELEYLAPNPQRATEETQRVLSYYNTMCCHAKSLKFIHPVSHKFVELTSKPSF